MAVGSLLFAARNGSTTSHGEHLPLFARTANAVSRLSGKPGAFAFCCLLIVLWAVTGPFFHFSDTWQLIVNTTTSIVTVLMVFLIQNTQNRDGGALQAKLDELIRATRNARNDLVAVERQSEETVERIRDDIFRKAGLEAL
ncbi:MAG TPA: low affinity iron permease family protein [Rhizomicrobium sp.]|jgi:low affinity Fe/Cu permease|nr:low affinity iron permease family protein [Rhizomicrobium sp.]